MRRIFFVAVLVLSMIPRIQAGEKWLEGYQKVLVIGAHPDDPESMCGGTMIKLRQAGAEVVCVYLTSGEAGIPGKTAEQARQIRQAESLSACAILDARPVFMTQVDGNTEINKERYAEMLTLIQTEKPDMVITHWPIDSHRDHRVCAMLVYDAWRQSGHAFDMYYTEVMTGLQTQNFSPTLWVDITDTRAKKLEAYLCHFSQGTADNVYTFHDSMERLRGMECQATYGEAFIQQLWK